MYNISPVKLLWKNDEIFDMVLPYVYATLTELKIYVPFDLFATSDEFSALHVFLLLVRLLVLTDLSLFTSSVIQHIS